MSGARRRGWVQQSASLLLLGLTATLAVAAAPPAATRAAALAPSASAAAALAPSANAATTAAPGATLAGADIPVEPSPAPKPEEWKTASAVRINRGDAGPCVASRVREWLRVRCPTWIGGGLVAGDPKGVTLTAFGDPFSTPEAVTGSQNRAVTTVVLPLRRGTASLVSFLQLAQEYNSSAYAEAGLLSVVWRSARPDPTLVMTQVPPPAMR